jgi:hypothetical protein
MEDIDIKEVYDNICVVTREDINKDVDGDVILFRPKEFLKVVIGKSVALNLQYEPSQGVYIGEKSKMPFFSKGPKKLK